MLRRWIAGVCLMFIAAGCTLTSVTETPVQPQSQITAQPTATGTAKSQSSTQTPDDSIESATSSESTPVAPPTTTLLTSSEGDCPLPTNWQSYTVTPGDTLSSIARRVNVTAVELAVANCLDNPDQIGVGQALYVPQQPRAPATFTAISSVSQCSTSFDYFFILNADLFDARWCPSGPPQEQAIMIQRFEHGYMLWRADTQTVYVLLHDPGENGGTVTTFAGGQGLQGPDIPVDLAAPSPGFYQPEGWFLTLWSTNQIIRQEMGRAVFAAQIYTGLMQPVAAIDVTVSDSQWVPRFFTNWSLNNNVLAVGSQEWAFAGIVALPPRGVSLEPESIVGFPTVDPFVTADAGNFALQAGANVTLSWMDAPVAQIVQAVFMLYPEGKLVGVDTDMSDGIAVDWEVTDNVSGCLVAIGYMPGQMHDIVSSNEIFVFSSEADDGSTRTPDPFADSTVGQVEIAPLKRIDDDVYVLQAGAVVSVYWQFAPTEELLQVEFVLYTDENELNGELLDIDSNLQDGALIRWTVPSGLSGRIIASGRIPGQGGEFRMSEERRVMSE